MKKITQEQLNSILNLLAKYNTGVQEYSAVEKMFNELPNEDTENKAENKTEDKTENKEEVKKEVK
jgi:hypothetical protein